MHPLKRHGVWDMGMEDFGVLWGKKGIEIQSPRQPRKILALRLNSNVWFRDGDPDQHFGIKTTNRSGFETLTCRFNSTQHT